ncbi:hypothetical protein F5984_20475 [Rudanella paleaurantiibacter]|uniref:Uncharacterized protein n=1 Tax=Rudanella paleaurantiibacter TaxID=2614655 RepID=A0A7J5TVF0_9BACT|nr:hypothetical protein [Rudanella paleaurantiibacter]KAB7728124.1 hypothetical protein F5984_20475 [Rudanella paleaurantiibacter]
MMTLLLEICFLAASITVLSLCFATGKGQRIYRNALYALAAIFFSCCVLSASESLTLNISGTLTALGVTAVAGIVTFFRTKEWSDGDRSQFLVRFAIVIPVILFVLVVVLRVLLQIERKYSRADPAPTAWVAPNDTKKRHTARS